MQAWYCVNTKSRAEWRVYHALTSRGFEAYLPLLPAPRRGDRRPEPLFPSYLFVCWQIETLGLDDLQYVPGLRRVVSFGGQAAIVPDEAVVLIRDQIDQIEADGGLPRHSFKPGDEVVIEKGALAGLHGIFQGPLGPAERVAILIRFLGQANRAQVPAEWLSPAPPEEDVVRRRRGTRGHGRHIHYRPGPSGDPTS